MSRVWMGLVWFVLLLAGYCLLNYGHNQLMNEIRALRASMQVMSGYEMAPSKSDTRGGF